MNKKCMKCEKPATHKFVRVDDDGVRDLYYCQEHAMEVSPYQKKPQMSLNEILAGFLSQEQAAQAAETENEARCESCGLPFSLYKKTLFLGCPNCYASFGEELLPELRKFHGNVKHIGRKPGGGKEQPATGGMIVPVEESASASGTIQLPKIKTAASKAKAETPTAEIVAGSPEAMLKEIAEWTAEMNRAIGEEDFERAAKYRDMIKTAREKLNPA